MITGVQYANNNNNNIEKLPTINNNVKNYATLILLCILYYKQYNIK